MLGKTQGDPELIPPNCIFHNYEYTDGYQPREPKVPGQILATMQYIMWESEIAQTVWDIIFQLLHKLGFTGFGTYYTNWNHIFILLDEYDPKNGMIEIIKINILLQAIYQIYSIFLELQRRFTNKNKPTEPQLDDKFVDYLKDETTKQLNNKIRKLIYLTPIFNFLFKKKSIKNTRTREMMPLPYTKYYDLSKEEMQLLSEIWKDMVHFEDNRLKIKPLKWQMKITYPP